MKTSIKIDGLKEINRLLKQLPRRTSAKVMRQSLRKALRPIANEAKRRAPVGRTKELKKSIGITAHSTYGGKQQNKNYQLMWVGNLRGKRIKGWYGHIVELGYGRQAPQPFLRPAFENNVDRALKIYRDDIVERISKESKKLRGK